MNRETTAAKPLLFPYSYNMGDCRGEACPRPNLPLQGENDKYLIFKPKALPLG